MKISKLVIGILTTVCASLILIACLVLGISYFTGRYYIDIKSFDFQAEDGLSKSENIELFQGDYSFWVKMPDRKIENKNAQISVLLFSHSGEEEASMEEDFSFGYYRNSSGEGQYYLVGSHNFSEDFSGALNFVFTGDWSSSQSGEMVIREAHPNNLITKEALILLGAILLGVLLLIAGIKVISRSRVK